jgi:hypothetical protein
MTDSARVIQVIVTDILRRGAGAGGDPTRVITQYWSFDGTLLWEVDPWRGRQVAGQPTDA